MTERINKVVQTCFYNFQKVNNYSKKKRNKYIKAASKFNSQIREDTNNGKNYNRRIETLNTCTENSCKRQSTEILLQKNMNTQTLH